MTVILPANPWKESRLYYVGSAVTGFRSGVAGPTVGADDRSYAGHGSLLATASFASVLVRCRCFTRWVRTGEGLRVRVNHVGPARLARLGRRTGGLVSAFDALEARMEGDPQCPQVLAPGLPTPLAVVLVFDGDFSFVGRRVRL